MNGREIFRQTTNDKPQTFPHKLGNPHKLGHRTNRWSKVQAGARCPSCKKQFKQQRQQCRLKDNLIFNLRTARENSIACFQTVKD